MRRMLGFIFRNFLHRESRTILYKTCVRPIAEYCSFLFSNVRLSDMLKLEGIQRKFTRKVLNHSSPIDYPTRCIELGLDPLWKRRLKSNLILYFKLLHKLTYSSCSLVLIHGPCTHNLRDKVSTVKLEKYRSKTRENFFLSKYALIWNRLPSKIRMASGLHEFVQLLNDALSCTDSSALVNSLAPCFHINSSAYTLNTLNSVLRLI
ncbi:unnamed protein product [Schistosoma turkestanicum]|nr:unnamed protein product [Schistosoma turkestanicum]